MGQWNLDQEYRLLVEEGFAKGEIAIRTDGPDLRTEPRFRVHNGRIAVRVEPQFRLVDISAAGVAFLSDLGFRKGAVLHVILKEALAFQARVVDCQVVETDAAMLELRYRVQCRFDDLTNGKQFLVLMKDMERIGGSVAVN
jgi:PilZ domain